jgi:SAM-dependent methyltransferase
MSKTVSFFDEKGYRRNRLLLPIFNHFRFSERDCLLRHYLSCSGEDILDAGCGDGFYSVLLKDKRNHVLAVDYSYMMVMEARKKGIKAEICDLENISMNRRFDKILCLGVLEFSKRPLKILKNLRKLLKESGSVILLFPKFSFVGILFKFYHRIRGARFRLFSFDDIRTLTRKAGFRIVKINYPNQVSIIIELKKIKSRNHILSSKTHI